MLWHCQATKCKNNMEISSLQSILENFWCYFHFWWYCHATECENNMENLWLSVSVRVNSWVRWSTTREMCSSYITDVSVSASLDGSSIMDVNIIIQCSFPLPAGALLPPINTHQCHNTTKTYNSRVKIVAASHGWHLFAGNTYSLFTLREARSS